MSCSGTFYRAGGQSAVRFAIIGDYGSAGTAEQAVATRVLGWNPDLILTTGDNNYLLGGADTIDANIGQYYHSYIGSYSGSYGAGSTENRFFPTLGNHDWLTPGATPYFDYFTLPGNEQYYDFVRGPVHFFTIDSNADAAGLAVQQTWLQGALAAATEPWKVVYMHHPPFSSGPHGSTAAVQWAFKDWGVNAVLSGHDHDYEHLTLGGVEYFVNGAGGYSLYNFGTPVEGSVTRYNADYGAMLVTADAASMKFEFYTQGGDLVDSYTMVPEPVEMALVAGLGLVVFAVLKRRNHESHE